MQYPVCGFIFALQAFDLDMLAFLLLRAVDEVNSSIQSAASSCISGSSFHRKSLICAHGMTLHLVQRLDYGNWGWNALTGFAMVPTDRGHSRTCLLFLVGRC